MKIIIFLFLFISQVLFSQDMRIEVRASKRKPDIYREYLLEIKIINASKDDYIIPYRYDRIQNIYAWEYMRGLLFIKRLPRLRIYTKNKT